MSSRGRHILVKLADPEIDETKLTRKMVVFELYDADDYSREVPVSVSSTTDKRKLE